VPIEPKFRWLYLIDWREFAALVRFERARGRCQRCRRPHGQTVLDLVTVDVGTRTSVNGAMGAAGLFCTCRRRDRWNGWVRTTRAT